MSHPSFRLRRRGYPTLILFLLIAAILFNRTYNTLHPATKSPRRSKIQFDFTPPSRFNLHPHHLSQPSRLAAVKAETLHAWTGYKARAWLRDEIRPVTGSHLDKYCGWAATLVDSLDTLWLMGLKDEFEEAVNATTHIDFSTSTDIFCVVNLFETTIRHLGGLLAAWDFSGDARLLPKLRELGNMLHGSFDTVNEMPSPHYPVVKSPGTRYEPSNHIALAALGSLNLEFTRLSAVLNEPKYLNSIDRVTRAFLEVQQDSTLPGLWPETMDSTGPDGFAQMVSDRYSLGALSDSTYEYLVKGHLQAGALSPQFSHMWHEASNPIREHLIFRPFLPGNPDILFSGTANVPFNPEQVDASFFNATDGSTMSPPLGPILLEPAVQHLACFQGGLFALAGRLFDNKDDFELGRKLTLGCTWAYNATSTGIMPEAFTVFPCDSTDQCEWSDSEYAHKLSGAGYCGDGKSLSGDGGCNLENLDRLGYPRGIVRVTDGRYLLRPEAIESVFIMWRLSGEEQWREIGWKMFESIRSVTRTTWGHSAIDNVLVDLEASASASTSKQFERQKRMTPVVPETGTDTPPTLPGSTTTDPPEVIFYDPPPQPNPREEGIVLKDEMESFWIAETLKYFWLLFSDPAEVDLDRFVLNTEAHPLRLRDGERGFG